MGQEIRSQIEAINMQSTNRPQHFTFDDSILDDLDFISIPPQSNEGTTDPTTRNVSSSMPSSSSSIPHHHARSSNEQALKRQIKNLESILSEKKSELKLHQEKASKDLKDCEQKYRERNQVERLHFENSKRLMKHAHNEELKKFKKEIAQVKSDARLIIDFVRRKANEAIAEESTKMVNQKRSIGKKMEALESQMKKTFHSHMNNLEEEVKMVMRKEKKAINLTILPPPPPRNISIMSKRKLNRCTMDFVKEDIKSIPSDEIEVPDMYSNDSISTCFSESGDLLSKDKKDKCISNEHQLLKTRVKELEEWTDTLTLALRSGAKIKCQDGVGIGKKSSHLLR